MLTNLREPSPSNAGFLFGLVEESTLSVFNFLNHKLNTMGLTLHIEPLPYPTTHEPIPVTDSNVAGLYFMTPKHLIQSAHKKRRRNFFPDALISGQITLAQKYAAENQEDMLIAQVIHEIKRP